MSLQRKLFSVAIPLILVIGLFGSPLTVAHAAPIYYVKQGAAGSNDGTSWADAFTDLQAALALATSGDQIWVAAGTYTPTGDTDPTVSFVLVEGVQIYGGFAGTPGTEGNMAERNWQANPTILSGDLLGDDGANFANNAENSFHVILNDNNGLTAAAVLDGFTISGGNARDTTRDGAGCGGGMLNLSAGPTLRNLVFSANFAINGGGGLTNWVSSNPTLTNVTFSGNQAGSGGGMYNRYDSSPKVYNSILWGDTDGEFADDGTGAITVEYSIAQGGCPANATCTNLLTSDPLFVTSVPAPAPSTGGDLHLQAGSPAINAGDNTMITTGITTDLDGKPRIVDGTVDIGAFEQQAPNHAPVLSDSFRLPDLHMNPVANPGAQISTFLIGPGVTDADGNLVGMAVTGMDTLHGKWQTSPDRTTWTDISGVDNDHALLLGPTTYLRFVPNADWHGSTSLTFRAWDGTDGRSSGTTGISTSPNGSATSCSTGSASLNLIVKEYLIFLPILKS